MVVTDDEPVGEGEHELVEEGEVVVVEEMVVLGELLVHQRDREEEEQAAEEEVGYALRVEAPAKITHQLAHEIPDVVHQQHYYASPDGPQACFLGQCQAREQHESDHEIKADE